MKKITFFTFALLTLGTASFAQQQRSTQNDMRSERMNRQGDNMADQLGLSAAQQEQAKVIREKYRGEMQAIRSNTALSPEDKRTQMKVIMDKQQAEIAAILTPEQRTKMEAMKNQRMNNVDKSKGEWKDGKGNKGEWKNKKGEMKGEWKDSTGKRGKMRKDNAGAGAMKELNLTESQKKQLQSLRQDAQLKTKEIRANTSLTVEQKKTQINSIHSELRIKQKAILTPDQQKKWDEKMVRGQSMKNA